MESKLSRGSSIYASLLTFLKGPTTPSAVKLAFPKAASVLHWQSTVLTRLVFVTCL